MPEPLKIITSNKGITEFQDTDDNSAVLRIKNKSRFAVVAITEESVTNNNTANNSTQRVTPLNLPKGIMTHPTAESQLGEHSNSSGIQTGSGKHTVLSKRDSKKTLAIKEEPSQNEEELDRGDKEVQAIFQVLHSEIGS